MGPRFNTSSEIKERGLSPVFSQLANDAQKSLATAKIFLPDPSNGTQFFRPKLNFNQSVPNTMPVLGTNVFGFPIFSNLIIKGSSYTDNSGNVIGKFNDIRLDVILMEIKNENNIIVTDIQGRNGSIIEYASSKSWEITFTGRILAKDPGIYPTEDVKNLIIALNTNRALQVDSWFLQMAQIYNIFIKNKNFPQEEGSQEYQKFEFTAISDAPVILKLNAARGISANNTGVTT